jgi:hypothetical protein
MNPLYLDILYKYIKFARNVHTILEICTTMDDNFMNKLPENIYKENFDVSSEGPSSGVTVTRDEGPSLETSKFSLYIFR